MNMYKNPLKSIHIIVTCILFASCAQFSNIVLHDPTAFNNNWVADSWTKGVNVKANGNTFSFDFPDSKGTCNTIEKNVNGLKVGSTITMNYKITGNNPQFVADIDTPTVGFYIAAARIYSRNYNTQIGRAPLKLGKNTLSVTLIPENWQTVDGFPCNFDQIHIDEFNKGVAGAKILGVCFGDNAGFAHGVNLKSGTAHFTATINQ